MDLFVAEFSASREDLTPFNDQISAFFSNRIIPVLKTLPASYGKTPEFSSHMKQMLDLKDVYKIFERCWPNDQNQFAVCFYQLALTRILYF